MVDPKYGLTETTPAAAQTITAAEAKTHLRVTHSDDDTYITELTKAARIWIEEYCNRPSVVATYKLTYDRFPTVIRVPLVPLISVASLKYIDSDGTQQTWNAANYTVNIQEEPGTIIPAWGETWPEARRVPGAVEVNFTAGYATAGDVPATMKQAARILVHDMYEARSSFVAGNMKNVETVQGLLSTLRHVEFS